MSDLTVLIDVLRQQVDRVVDISFGEIEAHIGQLPSRAFEDDVWWAHAFAGLARIKPDLGWGLSRVDLAAGVVTFTNQSVSASRKYWWVNHKQTFKAELEGGYIWSPMTKKDGAQNQAYINLTLVAPGDVVISYAGGLIKAIGIALARYSDSEKPHEYGGAGEAWNNLGWRVPIEWRLLERPFRPRDHLDRIAPLLPSKYSPIQAASGNGNQGVYLAAISSELGRMVLTLSTAENTGLEGQVEEIQGQTEEQQELDKVLAAVLPETEKEQLVRARLGQGLFRQRVMDISSVCILTGVSDERFLIASHIKPWRACNNTERLDGFNGFMLAPHVDRLFDRGWITFDESGRLLLAEAAEQVFVAWGLDVAGRSFNFPPEKLQYLKWHREHVFKL